MKKSLIAVVLVMAGLLIWQQSPTPTSQTLPTLSSLSFNQIAQFEIKRHGETLIQAKRDKDTWLLMGKDSASPIKTSLVEQLLNDVVHMQAKRVASTNSEHHVRFSVTDDAPQLIMLAADGQTLLSIFVGKPATDLRSTYVRQAGQDMVITVDKVLTWQMNRTAQSWLEEEVSPES